MEWEKNLVDVEKKMFLSDFFFENTESLSDTGFVIPVALQSA